MKKFICTKCGAVWYSAADNHKPCEKCGGKIVEETLDRTNSDIDMRCL